MYGFIITTAGEGLLARASAGEGLTLTEVWVGKGAVESAGAAKAPLGVGHLHLFYLRNHQRAHAESYRSFQCADKHCSPRSHSLRRRIHR